MTVKFTNNASTTVGTGINASATSLTVASASSFPSLSGADDYCYLTLQRATSSTREVVKATALSSNTFTIVRAQDNTSAASFAAGDIVELRMTAALLTDVIDAATVEGVKTNFQYTPTAGQTVFSGADNASNTLIINQAALVSVYMNGVRLVQGTDYSVSSANNTVTLTVGATTADIIDIEVFGNFTGQSGAAVAITGGAISGTSVAATTLSASGTATLNTFVSNNITVSGGSINNVNIGATTAGTGRFSTLTATSSVTSNSFISADNNTDDTNKIATFLSRQYDSGTETEGFLMMQSFANSSGNRIDIGGGGSAYNAATEITFNTAANTTTRTGTQRLSINSTGATFSGNVTADKYIMAGGSQIGQDYAYIKSASTTNASLTLRKDSTGADSIDFLQLRSDGNGLIGKIEGDGDISFKGATFSDNVGIAAAPTTGRLHVKGAGTSNSTNAIFAENSSGAGVFAIRDDGEAFILGNTGIGTSSPSRGPLHVHQPTSNTDSNIHLTSAVTGSNSGDGFTISVSPGGAGDTSVALIQRQNAPMKFYTHAVERMRLDQHGTLAVGTTDTHQWTVFDGRIRLGAIGCFATTSTSTQILSNAYYDNNYRYIAAQGASRYYQTGGAHYWEVASSGSADGVISFAEAMRIGSDKNVLIGTTQTGGVRLNSETNQNGNLAGQFRNTHATGSYGIKVMGGHDSSNYSAVFTDKDNATLMMIRGNGNVGIGLDNPLSPLSVQADSGAGVARFIGRAADNIASVGFYNSAQSADTYMQSNGTWQRSRADGGFHFAKGSTPSVSDTDGFTIAGLNLGVGTSAEGKLHVYNGASGKSYAADSADQLILENNSSVCFDIRTPSSNNGVILFSDESARGSGQINYSHNGDTMYFYTAGNLRASLNASGLAMTQSSATNPVLTLTDAAVVDYRFLFPDSSNFQLECHATSSKTFKITNTGPGTFNVDVEGYIYTGGGYWFNTDSNTGMYRNDTDSISFRVGGNDYFTIDGDATTYTHMFNSGTYSWYVGTSGNTFNFYDGGGTQRGYVHPGNGFVNGSDRAYKENISDITYGLETVKKLQPRKFKFKDTVDMADDSVTYVGDESVGFIAQELEQEIPELVMGEDGTKTVAYSQLTAVLAKAIQEQQDLIESLTARVAELENN